MTSEGMLEMLALFVRNARPRTQGANKETEPSLDALSRCLFTCSDVPAHDPCGFAIATGARVPRRGLMLDNDGPK
jgi:hypothetical protein